MHHIQAVTISLPINYCF